MRILSATLLLVIYTSSIGAARAQAASEVQVAVDPRIELLAAVQYVSGYGDWTGLITRQDFSYKAEVLAHFEPFKDHRAAELFAEMARSGFAFDAPVSAVLHHTDPPALEPIAPYPESLPPRAGGDDRLNEFIAALRDFVQVSGFMDFYEAHKPFYEKVNSETLAKIEGVDIGVLEDYYGVKQHSYRIIPAPLFHSGGFGPRIRHDDGRYDVYSVCGPNGVEDDVPRFGTPDRFRYLVWHEFSHSFVNPVVDAYGEEVDQYERLMGPISQPMARQAYPQWRTCVYEHVVRAATCRFAARVQGEDAGSAAIANEKSRSFIYVEPLCARLKQYEAQRDTYPTLASFFPELIGVFAEALDQMPEAGVPTVARTVPRSGERNVDPTIAELRVEFDQDMDEAGYSWTQRSDREFPETTGHPEWVSPRACVLPVRLEPNHRYWVGINAGTRGFRGVEGVVAAEYVIEFKTAASAEAAAPPKVVRTVPATGATDVDPNLTELIAEFDKDMDPRNYAWVQQSADTYPETTGKPFWRTSRICVLPVKLEPGRTYWLGLNVAPYTAFQSVEGTLAEQFILQFTTADDE